MEQILALLPQADIRRGLRVFQGTRASCIACHRRGYLGGAIGPDLNRIGSVRSERDLLESILFPSLSFVRSYEPISIVTDDGLVFNGLLRGESDTEMTLQLDAQKSVLILKSSIEESHMGKVFHHAGRPGKTAYASGSGRFGEVSEGRLTAAVLLLAVRVNCYKWFQYQYAAPLSECFATLVFSRVEFFRSHFVLVFCGFEIASGPETFAGLAMKIKLLITLVAVCVSAGHSFAADDTSLRVSTFQADVTPPLGSPLCNGNVKPVMEIVTPLTARGIVLLGADDPIVLCAFDWVGIGNESYDGFPRGTCQSRRDHCGSRGPADTASARRSGQRLRDRTTAGRTRLGAPIFEPRF